jgi:hypothetical protein
VWGPCKEDDTRLNRGRAYGTPLGRTVPPCVRTDGDHSAAVIINERSSMHRCEVLPYDPATSAEQHGECSVDSLGRGPELHGRLARKDLLAVLLLFAHGIYSSCSAELISTAYQPWNSVFLSQQISHSWLISQKNSLPNRPTPLVNYSIN